MIGRAGISGFTLLELLVVLTLLGLLLLVVPPAITSGSGIGLKAAARDVAAGLRRAQGRAIVENREVAFVLDLNAHRFRIDGSGTHPLPDDIELRLYTAQAELIDAATGAIRFYPDGSSTGGEITLSSESRAFHVGVDWLTGRISIQD